MPDTSEHRVEDISGEHYLRLAGTLGNGLIPVTLTRRGLTQLSYIRRPGREPDKQLASKHTDLVRSNCRSELWRVHAECEVHTLLQRPATIRSTARNSEQLRMRPSSSRAIEANEYMPHALSDMHSGLTSGKGMCQERHLPKVAKLSPVATVAAFVNRALGWFWQQA